MDLNRDYRKAVFLAGVGRSGTTWISEVINYNNDYRYIFEPFHPHKVPICSHFRYRQYLEPNNTDPRFIAPTNSILSGRIRTRWSESLNHKTLCDRRLIKDIRAILHRFGLDGFYCSDGLPNPEVAKNFMRATSS